MKEATLEYFGFVSEPHRNNHYLVSPASRDETGEVTCYDLSGFLGSWKMKVGGKFFESISGETLCAEAMDLANHHAAKMNGGGQ